MNINDKIINTLSSLKVPIFTDVADTKSDEYIVFNYADEYFGDYSDDLPETDTAVMQIHYFVKNKNPHTVRSSIVDLLIKAGFGVSIGGITYEDDTGYRHCVISAQYTADTKL